MSSMAYTRFELVRLLRNRRFFIFSLGFPLVLYVLIASPNRNVHNLGNSGISAPLYFMVGLVAFGTMTGVLGVGSRIAAERTLGWNRQLRLTPLAAGSYFRAKIVTAYLNAALTVALLYVAGTVLGVRLTVSTWVEMTALIAVGLIPFAALGVLIGHLLSSDSIGPAIGGLTGLFGFLGGVWFPIGSGGLLHVVAEALPSYWLVRASRLGIGGGAWPLTGWLVVALWTIVAACLAGWAYRRDTRRD
jgi:ABC-2 type transport system permease protein